MVERERLGEYFVRRLVGEGGMGKVYEAEERLSRRKVALKVLRPELGRSEQARQMFLNEMTILAHLDHPNIVRSLSCSEIDGDLVMALELLEGETLRQRLATRGRLPWSEAVAVVADVAAALTAAHGQEPPIVHRDLKPENLMIVAGDRVKVMDFGIGKVMQAIRKATTQSAGTLQYMSPEQIDAGQIDQRSDFYSLGLVLYEMLAGHPPFVSDSPRELLNQQCTAAPPPLPDDVRAGLPRGIERLMLKMLEKSAGDRPATAQEIVTALEPFVTAGDVGGGASSSMPAARVSAVTAVPTGGAMAAGSGNALPVANAPTGPGPVATPKLDTVALIQRAGPRQISTPRAIAIVLVLCAIAGLATYLVRSRWTTSEPAAKPAPAAR